MNSDLAGRIFACAVMAWMLFRFLRYGGLTGAAFGARIERTVGDVDAGRGGTWSFKVKVHALGGGTPDKAVGLEVIAKSLASYESSSVALSAAGAKKLAALIESAAQR